MWLDKNALHNMKYTMNEQVILLSCSEY
jgi:hypothetical protein